ncbi:putative toxin-antitoxin system toxin component, PIN family [Leptolyngbya sp. CCNP1308]|uniref:putative toxin-antitoxin system toxin component, PIN family n=1 Tax=Leptolyngbya sp. CCNP1308 TaxID=3110255 RepID=UPI002B203A75|nr:putative toxin-antitoxin system toxin component, PIN family [Leptolyngbya sp. CCNP1308]MEA5452385.1 putative toxin-antitoxin system toxin component, PIN family [Leptolyngbya sp. CCNP1308]
MPPELPAVQDCRDPLDVPFLQLAVVGRADYLVTGDRDLLRLKAASRKIGLTTAA